jgi:hypothetical protein
MVASLGRIAAGALVVLATLYPRLALLGGFPATDEGVYAFAAQLAHASLAAGKGLPDYGTLNLYPTLLSWVFSLDWNALLLLRTLDLIAALCAGWMLFRVAEEESASWTAAAVIAAVFSFAMNQHAIVQHGFKNSVFMAYVPLLIAVRLGLARTRSDDFRWHACGALVAIAVLLRETFAPFAALGLVAVIVGHGWKSAGRYAASGIAATLAVMLPIVLLRGGIKGLLAAYGESADLYDSMAGERWDYFTRAVSVTYREAGYILPFTLAAIAAFLAAAARGRITEPLRLAFWIAAAAIPLAEAMAKIGFPYHIAICFPGLCGLCALGWRSLGGLGPAGRALLAATLLVPTLVMAWPQFGNLANAYRTRAVPGVAAIREPSWPSASISRSNYLLLADAIRRAAPGPNATLSSSIAMLAVFPLSGLVPSAYGLEDLSDLAYRTAMDAPALRTAVRACPPDVIMVSTRAGVSPVLVEAVAGMPEYAEVAHVPIASDKDYGHFGGRVYRRSGAPGACRRVP